MSNALNVKGKPNFLKSLMENPSTNVNVDAPSLFTKMEISVLSNQEHLAAISEILLETPRLTHNDLYTLGAAMNKKDDLVVVSLHQLIELFSVLDDVCTEDNLFDEEHTRQGIARIYRQWKKTREFFDPDFERTKELKGRTIIYGLFDPRDFSCHYVGQSVDVIRRYRNHLKEKINIPKIAWINELKSLNLFPIFIILEETSEMQASSAKRKWIAAFKKQGIIFTGSNWSEKRRAAHNSEKLSKSIKDFWENNEQAREESSIR